jgi:hypothetical protein
MEMWLLSQLTAINVSLNWVLMQLKNTPPESLRNQRQAQLLLKHLTWLFTEKFAADSQECLNYVGSNRIPTNSAWNGLSNRIAQRKQLFLKLDRHVYSSEYGYWLFCSISSVSMEGRMYRTYSLSTVPTRGRASSVDPLAVLSRGRDDDFRKSMQDRVVSIWQFSDK